jgi:hypothetical protein
MKVVGLGGQSGFLVFGHSRHQFSDKAKFIANKIYNQKPVGSEVEFQVRLVFIMGSSPIGGNVDRKENKIEVVQIRIISNVHSFPNNFASQINNSWKVHQPLY